MSEFETIILSKAQQLPCQQGCFDKCVHSFFSIESKAECFDLCSCFSSSEVQLNQNEMVALFQKELKTDENELHCMQFIYFLILSAIILSLLYMVV
mmetsp:Transcript_27171/g.20332  ORF Transcript_27171/g.20332 Transcript_27171/m.20332 type:complete len:96 (+) Transcript_27171:1717-2004(+)